MGMEVAACVGMKNETTRKQCPLCGRPNLTMRYKYGAGKAFRAHKCPHGTWCVAGHRLNGMHANHSLCGKCRRETATAVEGGK